MNKNQYAISFYYTDINIEELLEKYYLTKIESILNNSYEWYL